MISSSTGALRQQGEMMLKVVEKLNKILYKNRGLAYKCTGFLSCLVLFAVFTACKNEAVLLDADVTSVDESEQNESENEIYLTLDEASEIMMVVHLCGAVNNPGVYELEVDSRIIDGIIKAGGFADDACEDALNLAMPITDGSRIYVPTKDEIAEGQLGADSTQYVQSGDSANQDMGRSREDSGLVNINTSGVDKLVTLPGIGESRAKSIIAYRQEHGAFKKIEDIMLVSGIKEGAFNKIKDYITVN